MYKPQPNQRIQESEKTKQWYIDCTLWIASNYNARSRFFDDVSPTSAQNALQPVRRMKRNLSFYKGLQENTEYAYTNQITTSGTGISEVNASGVRIGNNCETYTNWINGRKISSLVDYLVGKGIEIVSNIEPDVRSQSEAAQNKKTMLLEKSMLRFEAPELFETMKNYGIEYRPLGEQSDQFEVKEDVYRYMETDYRDEAESIGVKLAIDFMERNLASSKYKNELFHVICCGICGTETYIENYKAVKESIPPWLLIWDNTSANDDYAKKAMFAGRVEFLTKEEIISKYQHKGLTPDEIEEISNISTTIEANNAIPYMTDGIPWWNIDNNTVRIGVVKGYWRGLTDIRRTESVDKFGNTHIERSRKPTENWTQKVHQCTLIMGKYAVDYGHTPNQVRSTDNPSNVELPITIFAPNIVEGVLDSVVDRLAEHQQRYDYINNEITKMLLKNKGKNNVIHKNKLGSATTEDVLLDFARFGIHVSDGDMTQEDLMISAPNKLVEVVDMTLDPNIQALIALRAEERRLMEEIVNLNSIALGQQTGYVGAKTQAGTISRSDLGLSYLFNGFVQYIERDIRYAINSTKSSIVNQPETTIPVINSRQRYYLKITQEFQFEDLGAYIKVRDFITDDSRQRLISYAQAALQNQMIDFQDVLILERATTYSEIYDHLMYKFKKLERDARAQQQQQQLMQEVMAAQQQQAQLGMEQQRQEGANYRAELKTAENLVAGQPANI